MLVDPHDITRLKQAIATLAGHALVPGSAAWIAHVIQIDQDLRKWSSAGRDLDLYAGKDFFDQFLAEYYLISGDEVTC